MCEVYIVEGAFNTPYIIVKNCKNRYVIIDLGKNLTVSEASSLEESIEEIVENDLKEGLELIEKDVELEKMVVREFLMTRDYTPTILYREC